MTVVHAFALYAILGCIAFYLLSSDNVDLMSEDLLEAVRERCQKMEIPLVGVADVRRWESPPFRPWMPEEFYPQSIFPEARSVIVIGLPISLPVLETSPSIYYRELYTTVNALLDQYTYRLSNFLSELGHPSIFVPRDGYFGIKALLKNPMAFFSVRHAAFLAGLGSFGVNNMLLTPEYGPRVRFGAVFTQAALPSDPMQEEMLCNRCMRCVRMCPAGALDEEDYPAGLTDKMSCARHSAELSQRGISPCGICIKVCPVGEDRLLYHRDDASIYGKKERFPEGHRAWEHVRSYGGL
jgi:epoxyqueuosine reductase QueG